jgi:hypothetical protein
VLVSLEGALGVLLQHVFNLFCPRDDCA